MSRLQRVMEKKYFILAFLSVISIVLLFLSFLSFFLLSNFLDFKPFNAYASSSQATISLFVEGNDTTAPSIQIIFPENTTYSSNLAEINYTISDTGGLSSCWYTLDQGLINISLVCGNNVTGITSSEGTNIWRVYANDTSGNLNYDEVIFSVVISDGGSSGGGGGSSPSRIYDFEVFPDSLQIDLYENETADAQIAVKNTGQITLEVLISIENVADIVSSVPSKVTITPEEVETVLLNIGYASSGYYPGKIVFYSGTLKKEIPIVINVKKKESLFDVYLNISQQYKVIKRGSDINPLITLVQVSSHEEVEVTANYFIEDFAGSRHYSENETFFVGKERKYYKRMSSSHLEDGNYLAGIELFYPGGNAISTSIFKVSSVNYGLVFAIMVIIIILLIVLVLISLFLRYRNRKKQGLNGKDTG